LIKELYFNHKAFVRIDESLSEACSIGRAVRLDCSLSPLLFNNRDKVMIREVCHECERGIRVGGTIINMIRYTDDKAVVASLQKLLQELMN